MEYVSLQIPVTEAEQGEILTAELADYPFESFETEGGLLKAYIPQERLADCKSEVDSRTSRVGCGSGHRSTRRPRPGSWRWL